MHLNGRCSLRAKVAEDFEFVYNEPSPAVIGGDLANWELLLSASGFLVKKSDMRVGAVAQLQVTVAPGTCGKDPKSAKLRQSLCQKTRYSCR